MNVPHTPTPEELRTLADLGYSVSRIADKFDRSQRLPNRLGEVELRRIDERSSNW